jgi:hypothetical protein
MRQIEMTGKFDQVMAQMAIWLIKISIFPRGPTGHVTKGTNHGSQRKRVHAVRKSTLNKAPMRE